MKKKLITFVVMMVVFLIGCGTNSDSSSTTSEKASKSDIDTISDMYNEYQTESQDEKHEEDAELVQDDLGYFAYANKEKIDEAYAIISGVPEAIKESGFLNAVSVDISFYRTYLELMIYDKDERYIGRAEYYPDKGEINYLYRDNISEDNIHVLKNQQGKVIFKNDGTISSAYEYDSEGRVITEVEVLNDVDPDAITDDIIEGISFSHFEENEEIGIYEGDYAEQEDIYNNTFEVLEDFDDSYYVTDYTRVTYEYDQNNNVICELVYTGDAEDTLVRKIEHIYDDNNMLILLNTYEEPSNRIIYQDIHYYDENSLNNVEVLDSLNRDEYFYDDKGQLNSEKYYRDGELRSNKYLYYFDDAVISLTEYEEYDGDDALFSGSSYIDAKMHW